MRRFQIINHLINLYKYTKYLEIGVSRGKNFEKIKIPDKDGVDPNGNCNFVMTSDDFFKTNKKIKKHNKCTLDYLSYLLLSRKL